MNHELYGIVVTKVCLRATVFVHTRFYAEGGVLPILAAPRVLQSFLGTGGAQLSRGAARIWAGPRRASAERGEPEGALK